MSRIIAIGDIHGCSLALRAIVDAIAIQPTDIVVPLGDYVDRGIDSRGVLDELIRLQRRCQLKPILGNHDQMMLFARKSYQNLQFWMACGGDAALDSYGSTSQMDLIPDKHIRFLEGCLPFFETDTHVFLHANYEPDVPFEQLDDHTSRWLSLAESQPIRRHCSGKSVVVGHTPQSEVLDSGFLTCIDTNCCEGGWLTALDVVSGRIWQASEKGILRSR